MDADKRLCGRDPDSQYVELAVEVFAMLADATIEPKVLTALAGLQVNGAVRRGKFLDLDVDAP